MYGCYYPHIQDASVLMQLLIMAVFQYVDMFLLPLQSVGSVVRGQVQARCFHVSPLVSAAQKVAMSHLDPGTEMPYPKLQANLDIVKQRCLKGFEADPT